MRSAPEPLSNICATLTLTTAGYPAFMAFSTAAQVVFGWWELQSQVSGMVSECEQRVWRQFCLTTTISFACRWCEQRPAGTDRGGKLLVEKSKGDALSPKRRTLGYQTEAHRMHVADHRTRLCPDCLSGSTCFSYRQAFVTVRAPETEDIVSSVLSTPPAGSPGATVCSCSYTAPFFPYRTLWTQIGDRLHAGISRRPTRECCIATVELNATTLLSPPTLYY